MDFLTFLTTIAGAAVSSPNALSYILIVAVGGMSWYLYNTAKDAKITASGIAKELRDSLDHMKKIHAKCEGRVTKLSFILLKVMHASEAINLPLVEKEVEGLLLQKHDDVE